MYTRVALICACALVATIFAIPAPPKRQNKVSEPVKMAQERPSVIKRAPSSFVYPYNLWPLIKIPKRRPSKSANHEVHLDWETVEEI